MIKVLFICHGNICRSPLAEYMMKREIASRGVEDSFTVISRATSTEELGNPVYPPMASLMRQHGFEFGSHRARQITRKEFDESDMIVAMDQNNLRNLGRMFGPLEKGRIRLLSDFTDTFIGDVEDPWWTGNFERVYEEIEAGVKGLLDSLMEK